MAYGDRGLRRHVLGGGALVDVAVYGAAAGDHDETPDAVLDTTLEHVEKPDAVDAGVQPRIARRNGNAHLGGVVIHDVRPLSLHNEVEFGRGDVDQVEPGIGGNIIRAPAQQVVCDRDVVARREVAVRDMRADETGAAGDQDFHNNGSIPRHGTALSTLFDPPAAVRGRPGNAIAPAIRRAPTGPAAAVRHARGRAGKRPLTGQHHGLPNPRTPVSQPAAELRGAPELVGGGAETPGIGRIPRFRPLRDTCFAVKHTRRFGASW